MCVCVLYVRVRVCVESVLTHHGESALTQHTRAITWLGNFGPARSLFGKVVQVVRLIRSHTHICTCKPIYIYIFIYIYVYVCIYVYIHTYIHILSFEFAKVLDINEGLCDARTPHRVDLSSYSEESWC